VARAVGRFWMLENVRQYALEKLAEEGGIGAVRRRHAHAYADAVAGGERGMHGPETPFWLRQLDDDRENVRAAISFALSDDDAETALRICRGVWRHWVARGQLAEGRAFTERALAAAIGDPDVRMGALNGAGVLAGEQGDFAAARRHFEEMRALAEATGNRERQARVGSNLAVLAMYEGDYAEAIRLYESAAAILRELGEDRGLSLVLQNAGLAHASAGHRDRAISSLRESVELARRAGDPAHLSSALRSLGRLQVSEATGRALLREALLLARDLADRPGIVESLETLAAAGDPRTGAMLVGAAGALRAETGAIRQPDDDAWFAPTQAALIEALGPDEFAAAVAAGAEMGTDEAIERALSLSGR
jgi:tetratricopeptide (TPR) repeat protein